MVEYSQRTLLVHLFFAILFIWLTLIVETFTDLDMYLQNLWYDAEHGGWLITREMHSHWRWLFYGGMKKGVAWIGGIAVAVILYGIWKKKILIFRSGSLLALSLLLTPLLVNFGKKETNIFCPRQLPEFGGTSGVFRRVLEFADPATLEMCGDCFPAGHASGGFAITMLFFCLPKKWRWLGLAFALIYAWIMGLYQMLRGEHFLSDTLVTMFLAWAVNALLLMLWNKFSEKIDHKDNRFTRWFGLTNQVKVS